MYSRHTRSECESGIIAGVAIDLKSDRYVAFYRHEVEPAIASTIGYCVRIRAMQIYERWAKLIYQ